MTSSLDLEPKPMVIKILRNKGDRVFRGVLIFGGLVSFLVLAGIFGYLAKSAAPTLQAFGSHFFTDSSWYVGDGLLPSEGSIDAPTFGILPMLWGSVLISIISVGIALPLGVGIALSIVYLLPKRTTFGFTVFIDLIAAIPSIVFGLWGFFVLVPHGILWAGWLNEKLAFIPIFNVQFPAFEQSPFMAGLVLGIMITPIVAVVSRQMFALVPPDLINAAQALGGSRWTVIRDVVLPFSRGGIIGGAMLGLGRALGETVAVFFVLQLFYDEVNWYRILESSGGSIASLIIAKFGEASPLEISALFAAALALFVVTLLANAASSVLVNSNKGKK
jgi:phosphate transport system permease protein